VAHAAVGRQNDDELTLYKSVGIAVEDLVAAHLVYQRAIAR
jgi:ornithine cyclodeaminase/alanine dehydrogenase-like protein (mu-crystallin family)